LSDVSMDNNGEASLVVPSKTDYQFYNIKTK